MITSTLDRATVAFYTTSPRLTHACQVAVKRNKCLTRWADLQELRRTVAIPEAAERANGCAMVVLSHADDDPLPLTDARLEPVVAAAFHLLFTGPATHPDQVAQWMRTTHIRSEDRLHVVKVEDLEATPVSELLGRVCMALGDSRRGSIIDAYLVGDRLLVRGPKHRMLHIPLGSLPTLKGQPLATLRNFTIDPDGSFLFWPGLDAHLGWNQLLQAVDPAELRRAQQRHAGFNCRYGAAIRKVRAQAGIRQAGVAGLTERQLRRIEQGECRATTGALQALAAAHGLDVSVYMEELAAGMA